MVSTDVWGPPIWTLFHTLSVKLKDESFPIIGKILFFYIKRLCQFLPCGECSSHSSLFFSKLPDKTIDSKIKLINAIYIFHNAVNKRKNKTMFKYEDVVPNYSNRNIIHSYNHFAGIYNTNGNLNQINESFHRKRLLMEFKNWLMLNIRHFNR